MRRPFTVTPPLPRQPRGAASGRWLLVTLCVLLHGVAAPARADEATPSTAILKRPRFWVGALLTGGIGEAFGVQHFGGRSLAGLHVTLGAGLPIQLSFAAPDDPPAPPPPEGATLRLVPVGWTRGAGFSVGGSAQVNLGIATRWSSGRLRSVGGTLEWLSGKYFDFIPLVLGLQLDVGHTFDANPGESLAFAILGKFQLPIVADVFGWVRPADPLTLVDGDGAPLWQSLRFWVGVMMGGGYGLSGGVTLARWPPTPFVRFAFGAGLPLQPELFIAAPASTPGAATTLGIAARILPLGWTSGRGFALGGSEQLNFGLVVGQSGREFLRGAPMAGATVEWLSGKWTTIVPVVVGLQLDVTREWGTPLVAPITVTLGVKLQIPMVRDALGSVRPASPTGT